MNSIADITKFVKKVLKKIAGNLKMRDPDFISFDIRGGIQMKGGILPKAAFKKAVPKRVFHLVEGQTGPKKARIPSSVVIVAEEQNGKIVSVQQYHRR